MTESTHPHTDQETEAIAAIEEVIATVERCQREESVEGFVELFREDAIWTTSGGVFLNGRDEIAAFTAKTLPGAMKDLQGTSYELREALFIRPDVAAVKVRQRYLDNAGEPAFEENEGTPLYVMARDGERWQLVACQNTAVAAPGRS